MASGRPHGAVAQVVGVAPAPPLGASGLWGWGTFDGELRRAHGGPAAPPTWAICASWSSLASWIDLVRASVRAYFPSVGEERAVEARAGLLVPCRWDYRGQVGVFAVDVVPGFRLVLLFTGCECSFVGSRLRYTC